MSFLLQNTPTPLLKLTPSEPLKVLVVDERYLTRCLTVDLLSFEGYTVLEADSGFQALEMARRENPDLILIDLLLSDLDGLQVCRVIKQTEQTQNIPIILITVSDDRRLRRLGLEAGVDDFLAKPIERLELSVRVKTLVQQKRLNEESFQSKQVLFAIAKSLERRYNDNRDQTEKLVQLTKEFGKYLQLSQQEISNLMDAAYLHDIGTVAIPDAILLKRDRLTPSELEIVHQHVLIGEEICQPIRDLRGVLPIIRHHHERWDGSGYPDRLAGSQIPWLAQVFQIIDIYDALTSQRPHKQPLDSATALLIITEETENGWRNPQLVASFCEFIQQKRTLT